MSVVVSVAHLPSHSKAGVGCPLSGAPDKGPEAFLRQQGSVGHPDPHSRSASAFPGSRLICLPPSRARALGQPQPPFVPLMSLKCLAWAPASPAPTREKRTGENRKKLTPARLCCAPGGRAQGWPGTIPPGVHPGADVGPPPPFRPLYFRELLKMQIPGHNHWIEGLEVGPGMCISLSTPGDCDAW